MIYFIKDTVTQAIKIGYSKRPQNRVGDLQTGNPSKLVLLGTVTGKKADETVYHVRFAQYRLEGEWFKGDIIEEVLTIIAEAKQPRVQIRRPAMTEATPEGGKVEGEPVPEGGTLDKDSGIRGVCRIPGLRLKSFSLKLTERQGEAPPYEEADYLAPPPGSSMPEHQRQHFELMKQQHREQWEQRRAYEQGRMYCGYELKYVLEFETSVTDDPQAQRYDLQKLRTALFSAGSPHGLSQTFYDEDNAVIPFWPSPADFHVVGGQMAVTGEQGDAFRVVVFCEKPLAKELPQHHPAAKIKDVFTGENYPGEHPLTKAKKFVVSIR